MELRYAKRKPKHQELYKSLADPKCKFCGGRGTYYYSDAYMSSGVTVICECVPEVGWRKWYRMHFEEIVMIPGLILGSAFWIWTAILWWRWMHS